MRRIRGGKVMRHAGIGWPAVSWGKSRRYNLSRTGSEISGNLGCVRRARERARQAVVARLGAFVTRLNKDEFNVVKSSDIRIGINFRETVFRLVDHQHVPYNSIRNDMVVMKIGEDIPSEVRSSVEDEMSKTE